MACFPFLDIFFPLDAFRIVPLLICCGLEAFTGNNFAFVFTAECNVSAGC